MDQICERFKQMLDALKISNNAFAKSIGKTSTTINYIVDGRNKPSFDVLEAIFEKYPQLSRDWLLMGEGDMFRESKTSVRTDSYLQEYLHKLEEQFLRLNLQLEVKDKQIEKLMDLLGKPECDTETGVIEKKHPATKELEEKVTVQTA